MKHFRKITKNIFKIILIISVYPLTAFVRLFDRVFMSESDEYAFNMFSQLFSLMPGRPGDYLRSAFYYHTLLRCGWNVTISFGTFVAHSTVEIGDDVYIGPNCIIGGSIIEDGVMLGSNVHLIAGKYQHMRRSDGSLAPTRIDLLEKIKIGRNVWVGNCAIVMSSIGEGCVVGAGSVVTRDIPENVVAFGNPARIKGAV